LTVKVNIDLISNMGKKIETKVSIEKAKTFYGARSDYHLAQILGVTKQLVSAWRQRGYVRQETAEDIEGKS
jgi:hypothetical protein